MKIEELKRRKSYIVAKITKVAGAEHLREYMDLMLFKVETGFDGTIYELIMDTHHSLRVSSRKVSRVAEAQAARIEREGGEYFDLNNYYAKKNRY